MQQIGNARSPFSLAAGRGNGQGKAGVVSTHEHFTPFRPVALAVHKMGRGRDDWPIVAAITWFEDGEGPILRMTWRSQRGTDKAISLPQEVISHAERDGAKKFYLRDDRKMEMRTCDLVAFKKGKLQADGERYIPLAWLQPVPWRQWLFATETIRLTRPKEDQPAPVAEMQMTLW